MSGRVKLPSRREGNTGAKHFAKVYEYPGGIFDIIASSSPDFKEAGYEQSDEWSKGKPGIPKRKHRRSSDPEGEDLQRSMRRARANVRRLALANEFRWFVTLTFDPEKVDSHDGAAVVRKLNAWCSNAVQRRGLRYILVPERHKKGGIHFHGFFSDSLEVVDSGTMKPPGGGKPRKPRSKAQRDEWLRNGGQVVYNLPGWNLGFTTAIELYGEYPKAVSYVCKYIGKEGEKPAGRWYYSGGDLRLPGISYAEIPAREMEELFGTAAYPIEVPGRRLVLVNGVRTDVRKILECLGEIQDQGQGCDDGAAGDGGVWEGL